MSLNAHRVFENSAAAGSYHGSLAVSPLQEEELRDARDRIRDAIRRGLGNWQRLVSPTVLFDSALSTIAFPALRPKFRMQGSFSYRTQIEPAHLPPQEIDLDDGMFLPVSFFSNNGRVNPMVASQGLFLAVEQALIPLCREQGWTLVTDKPSCVRVVLSEMSHVDVALYALPDSQFAQLLEKAAKDVGFADATLASIAIQDAVELNDLIYRDLHSDSLMLAHRDEGWKPSDPRKLDEWFQSAVDRHGYQLRRVCKYLKGWRDYQWIGSRLSSIALMAAVVHAYDTMQEEFDEGRDDLALLSAARFLPGFLSVRIDNPVVEGQRLDEGWTADMRNDYVARASELAAAIYRAIERSPSPADAIAHLTDQFGERIPDDVDLLSYDGQTDNFAAASGYQDVAAAAIAESKSDHGGTQPWSEA